jgi:hypothetical protein
VGKKYVEEFEILERKLQAEKNLEESFNHWWNIFRHNMEETIADEKTKWESFLTKGKARDGRLKKQNSGTIFAWTKKDIGKANFNN